jgi:hypothetical protein
MPYLLVEYDHEPPISDDQLMAATVALTPCLQVRNIKRLRSWVSADRKQGVCEYYAPDAESLREAYHTAKVRFKRVWPAMLFEGETPPDVSPGAS